MTQGQMAEALGLTGTFVGMMERGDKPIEKRTALAVQQLAAEAVEDVSEHGFHVAPATAVGGWNVIFTHQGWKGMWGGRQVVLYGHYADVRHAERWASALERARRPRMQRRLNEIVTAAIDRAKPKS